MTTKTPGEGQTFETQVNQLVEKLTVDDKGEVQVPTDLQADPAILFAAKAERRRRDTQAAYTRVSQRARELEKTEQALVNRLEDFAMATLPADQLQKLEELKLSDPEAWRAELNKVEADAKAKLKEEVRGIGKKVQQESELERRTRILEDYNKQNPEQPLTDDLISAEIPPKYVKELDEGKITFEEFIGKCDKFLKANKVIKQPDDPKTGKTLDDVGGRSTPSDTDVGRAAASSYKDEVY